MYGVWRICLIELASEWKDGEKKGQKKKDEKAKPVSTLYDDNAITNMKQQQQKEEGKAKQSTNNNKLILFLYKLILE